MIGMSNDAKERYMRGEYQYARLTMERSPYEPYSGKTYEIEFNEAGTVYGGSVDVATGVLTVTHNEVNLGVLTWAYNSTQHFFYATISDMYTSASYSSETVDALSDIFAYKGGTVGWANMPNGTFGLNGSQLRVHLDAYTRVADFVSFVNGHQFVYLLANPVTFQITPEEVTTLLNENNIWADTGGVRVTYRATDGTEKECPKNLIDDSMKYQYSSTNVFIGSTTDGYVVPLSAGTYTISVDFNEAPYSMYMREENDTANTMLWSAGALTQKTFTASGGMYRFWAYRGTSGGGVDANEIKWVQIEKGSTATEYEPYNIPLAHITDGANNIPVTSLTAAIEYKQDLHGYDYPWVGGGGKNKIDDSVRFYRVTSDSQYLVIGADNMSSFDTYFPAGTYTISVDFSGEPYGMYMREENDTGNTALWSSGTQALTQKTFTISGGMYRFWSYRSTSNGGINPDKVKWVQIELGSTATTYEPYSNICPIEGWEEVKVTRTAGNTYNAANLVLSAGSGIEVIDANTIQVVGTTGQENRNVYPLIKGTAKTLKFDSAAIMSVGAGETYHIYERVNGVLNSIATVEQTSSTKNVTASVSADADALVIGGWSGLTTICEFRKIRLATGEIPEPLVITNADIMDGGYSINRYVVTGDSLQFGSCVSGELTLILDNHDGKFDNESFMSKEIRAQVGIMRGNNFIEYTSLGWFTVDESPKKLSKITLAALDRMMKFEKKVDPSLLSFPTTLYELLQRICEICGVVLRTGSYNFLNADYNVMEFPSIAQTYRDILSYICEINGSCAYMDINGELVLGWFSSTPAATLDTSNRFDSDIDEHAVIIYGVSVITETENFHAGTVGFDIQVGHNPLITYDEQAIADSLFAKVGGFTYYPFTASTMPMPFFEPMDGATFVDNEGNSHFVAITDVTFRLNRNTALSGKGQTIRETDYERKYGVSATYANVDEALEIIKNTIIKNAEIVTQQMQEIVTSYTGLYEAISSEFGSYRQETDAKITQNAEGLTQAYTNIQQIDSKYGIALTDTNEAIVQLADGAVATNTNFRSVTEAYIKSGLLFYEGLDPVYGVAVGQLTYEVINGEKLIKRKGVYSVFTAEELAFYVDDVKVAYFRNNKLYISNAEFLSAVRIGDYTLSADGNGFTIR